MGIYRRKGSSLWWYKFTFDGVQIRESSGTSDAQIAEQVEAKRKREIFEESRLGIKAPTTWETAVVSYVATLAEGRNKEQTKAELRWMGTHIRSKNLSQIDLAQLEKLQAAKGIAITKRTGKPPAPGTINRVMGIAMAVLHHAASKQWITHVPALTQIHNPVKVVSFITRELAGKLLLELPRHQVFMVIFALETGLRKSNVTQLRWSQVSIERRMAWIHPTEAKEDVGIPVPLSETALWVLQQVMGDNDEFCFVYRGKPVKQTSTKAWKKAKQRAGVPGTFTWHMLRHTWASWLRQDGTPTWVLKELGGWRDDRMPGRYAHLGDDHLAEYVDRRVGLDTLSGTAALQAKQKTAVKYLKQKN